MAVYVSRLPLPYRVLWECLARPKERPFLLFFLPLFFLFRSFFSIFSYLMTPSSQFIPATQPNSADTIQNQVARLYPVRKRARQIIFRSIRQLSVTQKEIKEGSPRRERPISYFHFISSVVKTNKTEKDYLCGCGDRKW